MKDRTRVRATWSLVERGFEMSQPLRISLSHRGDEVRISPCGELDPGAIRGLMGTLIGLGGGSRPIKLDLSGAGFLDPSLLLAFMSVLQEGEKLPLKIRLTGLGRFGEQNLRHLVNQGLPGPGWAVTFNSGEADFSPAGPGSGRSRTVSPRH